MTMVKIVKVEDVSPLEAEIDRLREIIEKNFVAPSTVGEINSDTEHQRARRERVAEQRALEREYEVKYGLYFAYGTSRARQLELSAELDVIEARLKSLRATLAGTGAHRVAKSDSLTSAERGADSLGMLLRTPSLKKADLPDPLELDNSMGVRSQPKIQ
jgi:hypothetical protein